MSAHILRRLGFGASPEDLAYYGDISPTALVQTLLNYEQVADDVGMHESTISRVTANKYLYCPQGMVELKYFFNAGLQRTDLQGEMLSSVTVREMIRRMVAEEDSAHPLKDEEIAARLRGQQIMIARRTVAKYRAEENIPSASQRKRFF